MAPVIDMGKYYKIFSLSLIHSLKNYKALAGLTIFLVTCLLIFANIWKVAATKTGMIDLHPDQLLWYIAMNEWLLISIPDIQEDMEQDLRQGRLAYLIPRPISYLNGVFFEGLGILFANFLILGLITFSFAWVYMGTFSLSITALLLLIVVTLLAAIVALLFRMIIGLSSFWLQQSAPLYWIWEKLLFTLGGLMLPLAVYPHWLQKIAYYTPFPALLGLRSALVIDFNFSAFFEVISALLFWSLVAITTLLLLYKRGLRIVNVEGG